MKLTPFLLGSGICIASSLIGMSVLEVSIASANSRPNLPRAVNALSYPRSSQRFIEKRQAQLETEIKYLQQNTLASPLEVRINRGILHLQQIWQQKQERWLRKITR